jgi:acetyl-CoA acetyltransferase
MASQQLVEAGGREEMQRADWRRRKNTGNMFIATSTAGEVYDRPVMCAMTRKRYVKGYLISRIFKGGEE